MGSGLTRSEITLKALHRKAVSGGGFWKGEISYVRFWDKYSYS